MTHFILHSLPPFAPVCKIIDTTEACGDDSKVSESEGSRTLAMSGFAVFFFFCQTLPCLHFRKRLRGMSIWDLLKTIDIVFLLWNYGMKSESYKCISYLLLCNRLPSKVAA